MQRQCLPLGETNSMAYAGGLQLMAIWHQAVQKRSKTGQSPASTAPSVSLQYFVDQYPTAYIYLIDVLIHHVCIFCHCFLSCRSNRAKSRRGYLPVSFYRFNSGSRGLGSARYGRVQGRVRSFRGNTCSLSVPTSTSSPPGTYINVNNGQGGEA